MIPYQKAGYNIGDVFRVTGDNERFPKNSIVVLNTDTGGITPLFHGCGRCEAKNGKEHAYIDLFRIERIWKAPQEDITIPFDEKFVRLAEGGITVTRETAIKIKAALEDLT